MDKTLAGDGADIKEYLVGAEAFGRGQDFDPRIDSVVRVVARRVRERLDEYYRTEGLNDPILIRLGKGSYVPSFEARGEAACARPAEASESDTPATVFEVAEAPESKPREAKPFRPVALFSSTARHRRIWWLTAAGVGMVAAVAVLLARIWHEPTPRLPPSLRRLTTFASEAAVTSAAISPDGSLLAYSNPGGLYLQRIDTGETYTVSSPDARFKPAAISWFPDGSRLLVSGFAAQATDWSLWMIPVLGGSKPVKMGDYRGGLTSIGGSVSPDGSQIAFESTMGGAPGIWIQAPEGGEPRRIVAFGQADALGSLRWTDAHHLGLVRLAGNSQGTGGAILSCDARDGRVETVFSGADLSGDSIRLPDGRIVFGRYGMSGAPAFHSTDYWQIETDARTGKAVGRPARVTDWQESVGGLSGAASGKRMAFQRASSQHSVYVGDLAAGNSSLGELRRLTFGEARDDYPHAWTADSKAIYVESSRTGHWAIFKQDLGQPSDEAVIQGSSDLYYPRVSPDGAWLLYIDRPRDWQETQSLSLMRLAIAAGGRPQLVLKATAYAPWGFRFNCPSRPGSPCALAERQGNQIVFRAFDPLNGFLPADKDRGRIAFDPKGMDWDLAPDGSRLAWVTSDPQEARIHIEGQPDVVLDGWSGVNAISWSPNGDGWFVVTQLRDSWTLLHAGLDGRTRILRQGNSRYKPWPVPSPDGRHMALSQEGTVSNVWMLEER